MAKSPILPPCSTGPDPDPVADVLAEVEALAAAARARGDLGHESSARTADDLDRRAADLRADLAARTALKARP